MYNSPHRLRHAARILYAGGLVAHPTEGVWGLACDPLLPAAVMRLLAAKRRDPDKGLIVVADNIASLLPFLAPGITSELDEAKATWPGATTWLLPANPALPWWLRGEHETIAVRISDHPVTSALCRACGGPLVSSSANRSGHVAARHAWQARAQLRPWLDMVLAGNLQTPGQPSVIKDAATGSILRG